MPEKSFARIGYKNASGNFEEVDVRAQDVVATTGVSAETHITDAVKHLTSGQAGLIAGAIQATQKGAANGIAPLGPDSKIPAQYIDISLTNCSVIADNYTALLTLNTSTAPLKTTVLVKDASGDSTVKSGWALYFRTATNGNASDWLKLMEGEGLDIDFTQFIAATEKGTSNGVATLGGTGKVPVAQLPNASTSATGIVQLIDAVDSEDSTKGATPKAVKKAYDTAVMLDAAYCTDEADMATKNLRVGAIVLMNVQNDTAN